MKVRFKQTLKLMMLGLVLIGITPGVFAQSPIKEMPAKVDAFATKAGFAEIGGQAPGPVPEVPKAPTVPTAPVLETGMMPTTAGVADIPSENWDNGFDEALRHPSMCDPAWYAPNMFGGLFNGGGRPRVLSIGTITPAGRVFVPAAVTDQRTLLLPAEQFRNSDVLLTSLVGPNVLAALGPAVFPAHPSSIAGTIRASEDNNVLPKSRLIFNYDYFNGATFLGRNADPSRFILGFEQAVFGDRFSVLARMPFVSTVDSQVFTNAAQGGASDIGNLQVAAKWLYYSSETLNLSTGIAATLPTAPGTSTINAVGATIASVKNQSVIVEPYFAALWTPDERLFAQAWASIAADVTGSPIRGNYVGLGFNDLGRLYSDPTFSGDLQLGYWLLRGGPDDMLQGLAPFVELHYVGSVVGNIISEEDISTDTSNYRLTNAAFQDSTVTLGGVAQFDTNLNLNVGLTLPLFTPNERMANYSVGFRLNYLYGSSIRAMGSGY
ncbi:MAG: hypothetical protein R3B84_09065 [Zavarzinella sp.]